MTSSKELFILLSSAYGERQAINMLISWDFFSREDFKELRNYVKNKYPETFI